MKPLNLDVFLKLHFYPTLCQFNNPLARFLIAQINRGDQVARTYPIQFVSASRERYVNRLRRIIAELQPFGPKEIELHAGKAHRHGLVLTGYCEP